MKRAAFASIALAIALFVGTGSGVPASAQMVPHCPPGESPQFRSGFAELKQLIGATMGDPVECEHPLDSGDMIQGTTTGVAFFRKLTNVWTFTDGDRHWAITPTGFAFWVGGELDPPAYSVSSPAARAAAPRPPTASSSAASGPASTAGAPPPAPIAQSPAQAPTDPGRRVSSPIAYLPDDRQMPSGFSHVPSRDRSSGEAGGPDYYLKYYQSDAAVMVLGAAVTPSSAHAESLYEAAIADLIGQGWVFGAPRGGVESGEEAALGVKSEGGILGLSLFHRIGSVVLSVSWAGLQGQEDPRAFGSVWQTMAAKARANPNSQPTIRASIAEERAAFVA